MSTFTDSYKVPALRKKMWFTFLILSVLVLLSLVPVPGLDHAGASAAVAKWGDAGELLNIMSFQALGNVAVTSLGLYPFLIASIIMQILTIAVPKLRAIAQTGDAGTKIITKFTRIAAVAGDIIFAVLYCVGMRNHVWTQLNYWVSICLAGLCLAAGAAFFGWCIELINTKGIGSGLVIVILACVVRSIPDVIFDVYKRASVINIPVAVLIAFGCAVLAVALIVLVIWFDMGGKKLRIVFSKRTVGMKQYGMQNQVLPLKVAQAGTMPIVYSLAIMLLPAAIICLVMPEDTVNPFILGFINFKRSISFYIIFAAFISFFTYLFAMVQFNPIDLSNQIKQNGGYIQGLRPGKQTAQYLMSLYKNFFIADTAFLACLCIIPMLLDLIPVLNGIWYLGIVVCLLGGGFVELNTVLENGIETEEEKSKASVKDKKKNKYAK